MAVNGQGNPAMNPAMYMTAQQPGNMMAMQQQQMVAPPQTQIVINSTSDGPDGQPIQTQRVLTIYMLQQTQEVQDQIKLATDLSEQGNYDQALGLLQQLGEQQKITMQETATQNVSIPEISA